MLIAAAAVSNISMTDFLLNAARKAAETVLAEYRQITLNQESKGSDSIDLTPFSTQIEYWILNADAFTTGRTERFCLHNSTMP